MKYSLPWSAGGWFSRPAAFVAILSSFVAVFSALAKSAPETSPRSVSDAKFVGSKQCAQCHVREHAEWLGSHHKSAMQEATEATVLGNFENAEFSAHGITSTFFRRDGKFWVRTDGPAGNLTDFEIRYVFGITPLQQYLIELSGGRLQALGIAWDARSKNDGGQRWYHLYPDQKLTAGHPLHWTGIDQNWNYQCAYCHSTNLQKNYDAQAKHFDTTWSEISVGCEACHGPAASHVAWAARTNKAEKDQDLTKGFAIQFDERKAVTWDMGSAGQAFRSVPRATEKELNVCAACHARRQQFSAKPDDVLTFFDAFRPSYLEPGLYHVDGQQRDEVFNYGSFAQSKMHAAGVTCSDCHNPHSGKLHQSGNAVCSQCHAPERYDTLNHHKHEVGSKGSECVSCHMPPTVYMGVDARHDHSMRVPRPDRSAMLGTPNACNQCHQDQSATWASDAIKAWYPSPKPGSQDFAEAFDRGDRRAPGAQAALLEIALSESSSAIARASALSRLAGYSSPQILDVAARSLKDPDPMVRSSAVSIIAGADPATRRALLVPLLSDKTRLVRIDAARGLAAAAPRELGAAEQTALEGALAEYVEAQMFNAERPESHANLGAVYRDKGQLIEAQKAFEAALQLDPTFYAAAISLADLLRTKNEEAAAEKVLRQSLIANPQSGALHYALGLSLIRQKKTAEAMQSLEQAAKTAPEEPRFSYVYAVALNDTGSRPEAMAVLKSALTRHPYDRDILWALATYEYEDQDYGSALARAKLLDELEPERQDIAQLLAALQQRVRQ
jgi:Tfp pilus assembly protein PilF